MTPIARVPPGTVDGSRRDEVLWLIETFWGSAPGISPVLRRGGPHDYVVVPSADRPRVLIPADRRSGAASLRPYGALRSHVTHLSRRLLSTGLRLGLARPFLRDGVSLQGGDDPFTALLEQVLGAGGLTISIGVRGRALYSKPVIQVLGDDGRPVAFVKVGWDPITASVVRREASVLGALAQGPSAGVRAPRSLALESWNGLLLSFIEPLPLTARRHRGSDPPDPALSHRLASHRGLRGEPLGASPYFAGLRDGLVSSVAGSDADAPVRVALERIRARFGDLRLDFGTWHGDWAPWNLAWDGAALYAIDWEHSADEAPLGLDLVHYPFARAFRSGKEVPAALRAASAGSRGPLGVLGLGEAAIDAVQTLHMVELFARAHRAVRGGVGPGPRLHAGLLASIRRFAEAGP